MKTAFFLIFSITLIAQDSKSYEQKFYNFVGVPLDTLLNFWGYPDGEDYGENGVKIIWFERNNGKAIYSFAVLNKSIRNSVSLSRQGDDVGTVFWFNIYQGSLIKDGFVLVGEQTKKKAHYKKNNLHISLELYKDESNLFTIECRAFLLE